MMTTILIIIGSCLVAGGQALLKTALDTVSMTDKTLPEMFASLFWGFLTFRSIFALCLVGMGSVTYFLALRLGTFSSVVPATASLIIGLTALIGWTFMKDPMPLVKIAGLLFIIGGVYLVSRPA